MAGEFEPTDAALAGRAVLHATARFYHPAHAVEWRDSEIEGGVSKIAPRLVPELVPLTKEVVAVVIPDLADARIHHRDLGDVRSIDDHFTAIGDNRLQLVEALGCGPDVLILRRHDRQHSAHRMIKISDMGLRRDVGARCP